MKKYLFAIMLSLGVGVSFTSCDELAQVAGDILSDTGSGLSSTDVANGLKAALEQGTVKGVNVTSLKDGFLKNAAIKILFPPEVQKVQDKLEDVGLGNLTTNLVTKMNRAAEDASKSAKPIFINAVRSMTIQDAWSILKGEPNAATNYLKKTTSNQLFNAFNPTVKNSLDKVGVFGAWKDVTKAYNTATLLTGGEKVDTDINSYVTNKAIDGLFFMIEKEEAAIRKDPAKRVTDLLKKVFAQQD